jgi:hypothetical protein
VTKVQRQFNEERVICSNNGAEILVKSYEKEPWHIPHTLQKNEIKVDHSPNIKIKLLNF